MKKLKTQKFKTGVDTDGAHAFARDNSNDPGATKLKLWEVFSNYRIKKWKQEVKELCEKTGIGIEELCTYVGVEPSGYPGFYKKLPKQKEMYIAIGMAFKLPLKTINRWLTKYGEKRTLYPKDVLGDLAWIYLIQANHRDTESDINYFMQYESCSGAMAEIYNNLQMKDVSEETDTVTLSKSLESIVYDDDFRALKKFVRENKEAFESAYAKPRAYLEMYLQQILETKNETEGKRVTLNTLRGYLDDSMINYLTSTNTQYIPKGKRTHIALGLALGMTTDELDVYLKLMGYAPLDAVKSEEGVLINALTQWEAEHPLQKQYKEKYFGDGDGPELTLKEEAQAVKEMLHLRGDVKVIYETASGSLPAGVDGGKPEKFPYMYD